jgi:hypothetical protein
MNTRQFAIRMTHGWGAADIEAGIGGVEFVENEPAGRGDAPQSKDSADSRDQKEATNIPSVPVPRTLFVHVQFASTPFLLLFTPSFVS